MTSDENVMVKVVASITILLIALPIIFGGFFITGVGEVSLKVRFGNIIGTYQEGLHFKIPMIDSAKTFDTRTQKFSVSEDSASKDLQNVTAEIAVNYGLDTNKVSNLYKTVGVDYKSRIIDPSIQESIKAVTAKYTAEELITKRANVSADIKASLSERLNPYGIILSEISITDFQFSQSFDSAIEAKVTAEQNALASKNKLEQVKYEAEQRIAQAKGEAEAIRIQVEAITTQGGEDYIKLKAIEEWDGVLPAYMLGDSVPFINIQ